MQFLARSPGFSNRCIAPSIVKPLITHIFDIEEAEKAYDIVLGKVKEKFIGILLEYPENWFIDPRLREDDR